MRFGRPLASKRPIGPLLQYSASGKRFNDELSAIWLAQTSESEIKEIKTVSQGQENSTQRVLVGTDLVGMMKIWGSGQIKHVKVAKASFSPESEVSDVSINEINDVLLSDSVEQMDIERLSVKKDGLEYEVSVSTKGSSSTTTVDGIDLRMER